MSNWLSNSNWNEWLINNLWMKKCIVWSNERHLYNFEENRDLVSFYCTVRVLATPKQNNEKHYLVRSVTFDLFTNKCVCFVVQILCTECFRFQIDQIRRLRLNFAWNRCVFHYHNVGETTSAFSMQKRCPIFAHIVDKRLAVVTSWSCNVERKVCKSAC